MSSTSNQSMALHFLMIACLIRVLHSQGVSLYVTDDKPINAYKYQLQNVTCPPDQLCKIKCDGNYGCDRATIQCPDNNQCDIVCSAPLSCNALTILPPRNQSLFNLTFPGQYSMFYVSYPIYRDNSSDLTLICDKFAQCSGMDIVCPAHAKCNIHCVNNRACYFVKFRD